MRNCKPPPNCLLRKDLPLRPPIFSKDRRARERKYKPRDMTANARGSPRAPRSDSRTGKNFGEKRIKRR